MPAARGTFIAGTADGTVSEARNSQKRQRTAVNVSEDLLNRQIHEYGLVSPERSKNLVWSYFKKYGRKNLTRGHENLKLQQQALCTICLGDQDRRWAKTIHRLQELMQHDEEERKRSAHVDEPTRHTDSHHQSVNSHTTNLLGCKKTPKVVPPSAVASAQNVVDFANLAKEVSPRYTNFQSPLLYTYQ
jgi:hypothetical protein